MQAARLQLRRERRAARAMDGERLEELAPKAQAGTKERQLEKRKELAASHRAFAAQKEGGDGLDMPDTELLGGGEESLEAYKKRQQELDRKKSERELRKDEVMRARRAEREERARQFQQREDKTMESLLQLARDRYG